MSINISKFGLFKKYGLLINDTDVLLVSWKQGTLEKIAVFANDENGLEQFDAYMRANEKKIKNNVFYILSDIIGEDYRIEKVTHLVGKYKVDFHHRRMQQLFRGSNLCMSMTQGREEQGRRDDYVLFYGLLTENKVLPWVNIVKNNTSYLAGVFGSAFVSKEVLQAATSEWSKGNSLLMTIHEKGLFRQTFFSRGQPRFSRVSKIDDSSAQSVALAIRKELERTIQYLNSLKISTAGGINVEIVCPGAMVSQLREIVASGEKIKFSFHDGFALAKKLNLTNSIGNIGQDSSIILHSMFCFPRLKQLAKFSIVRFYRARLVGNLAVVGFLGYFLVSMTGTAGIFLQAQDYKSQNDVLTTSRNIKKQNYADEARLSQDPPSSSANIGSVSKTFRLLSKLQIYPSQLFYYFSRSLSKNKLVQINNMRWYITNESTSSDANNKALFTKKDFYQILEVSGQFLPVAGETYLNVADRADSLMESLNQERADILVEAIERPSRELEKEALGGVLDEGYAVDSARNRTFKIKIVWKEYDSSTISSMATEI